MENGVKKDVEYLKFFWPMRSYLVTCMGEEGRTNIITLSFCMPVSKEPPMVGCAVADDAYSLDLIEESGEFVVNVPGEKLRKAVYYCGFHSGRDVDKFHETGLTPAAARRVGVPVIEECAAHMECVLEKSVPTGDKILLIGKVVEAYAEERFSAGSETFKSVISEFPQQVYGGRFK